MRFKIIPVVIISIIIGTVLCSCAGLFGKKKGGDALVSWDEGLTSGVTRITNDGIMKNWLRVSPDGTKLLYTEASKSGYWQIMYLRDANNPAKTPLIGEIAYMPSWYTDNNQFVYISHESGIGRIVRSNVSGGGKTYISRSAIGQYGDNAPLMKNGVIVFTAINETRFEIATIKENGTETTFLGEGRSPSWHPTQEKIVFIRNAENPFSTGGDIFEMDMKSGQVTQIYSDTKYLCYEPSYSPDGHSILFTKGTAVRTSGTWSIKDIFGNNKNKAVSDETVKRHIFIMNTDGSNVSPISSGNASVISPSWGKNGEVYCLVGLPSQNYYEIYKLRIKN